MAKNLKPSLEIGDRIILYFMEGENEVSPGTKGTVVRISQDPFVNGEQIVTVDWDNGSKLPIVTETDFWKKIEKKPVSEQQEDVLRFLYNNEDLRNNFNLKFLFDFLVKIRNSGIVNMLGSAPLLYSGRDHIERYYGEGKEDSPEFEEVLEIADEAKQKFIQGILSYMENKDLDLDDIHIVNNYAKKLSQKILKLYILMH